MKNINANRDNKVKEGEKNSVLLSAHNHSVPSSHQHLPSALSLNVEKECEENITKIYSGIKNDESTNTITLNFDKPQGIIHYYTKLLYK